MTRRDSACEAKSTNLPRIAGPIKYKARFQ